MTQGLAVHAVLAISLPVYLATANSVADQLKLLASGAITVTQVLLPLIALFRILYRFAESREGNLTVYIAEVAIIALVSAVLGQIMKALLGV
jgi:hypothetical protein